MNELKAKFNKQNKKGMILKSQNSKKCKNPNSLAKSPTLLDFKMKNAKSNKTTKLKSKNSGGKQIVNSTNKNVSFRTRSTKNLQRWNVVKNANSSNNSNN